MTVTVTYVAAELAVTNSTQDLRQCPNNSGTVELVTDLRVTNVDGTNSATITIERTDASNTHKAYWAYQIPVPAGMSLVIVEGLKVLPQGHKLRAVASATGDLEIDYSGRTEVTS